MTQTQLLAYLAEHQPVTAAHVAEHFGIAHSTVRDSLRRLLDAEQAHVVTPGQVPGEKSTSNVWALTPHGQVAAAAQKKEPAGGRRGGIVPSAIEGRCALFRAWLPGEASA